MTIDVVGINADMTVGAFSAGNDFMTMKATEMQWRTETNISEYRLQKTNVKHGSAQKPRARRKGIKLITISALASVMAHRATHPNMANIT